MDIMKCGAGVMLGAVLMSAAFAAPAEVPDAAAAVSGEPPAQAQIAFADRVIWSWQVVDDRTVLIKTRAGRWYKATLFGICFSLTSANIVGFKANPNGNFDKFSSIVLRDQPCQLSSLVEIAAPVKKSSPPKNSAAPAAAAPPAS